MVSEMVPPCFETSSGCLFLRPSSGGFEEKPNKEHHIYRGSILFYTHTALRCVSHPQMLVEIAFCDTPDGVVTFKP